MTFDFFLTIYILFYLVTRFGGYLYLTYYCKKYPKYKELKQSFHFVLLPLIPDISSGIVLCILGFVLPFSWLKHNVLIQEIFND